jgi:hypothetical protein
MRVVDETRIQGVLIKTCDLHEMDPRFLADIEVLFYNAQLISAQPIRR